MSIYRYWNNNKYVNVTRHNLKRTALQQARMWRERGYHARVLKYTDGKHDVWIHRS